MVVISYLGATPDFWPTISPTGSCSSNPLPLFTFVDLRRLLDQVSIGTNSAVTISGLCCLVLLWLLVFVLEFFVLLHGCSHYLILWNTYAAKTYSTPAKNIIHDPVMITYRGTPMHDPYLIVNTQKQLVNCCLQE
jgi:hypothetical protein